MKRSIGILLSVCLLLLFCFGCNKTPSPQEFKYKLPDNQNISLNAPQAEMIQVDHLTEMDGSYQKSGEILVGGVAFEYASFSFEDDRLSHAAYFGKQSDSYEEDGNQLISFFNEMYGASEPHEGKDGYWTFALESGEKYSLSLDIQSSSQYVFLFLYRYME